MSELKLLTIGQASFFLALKRWARFHFFWLIMILVILYPGDTPLDSLVIRQNIPLSLPEFSLLTPFPLGDGTPVPTTSAKGVVVQDATNKSMLYVKNPNLSLAPASTTKLMTAIISKELYPDLEQPITITLEDRTLGQTMDLVKNESITVRDLLAGLLIRSANDAALALALNAPGGYDNFILQMNQKAKELGMEHTTYKNPSGLEQYGHQTTALDLAKLITFVAHDDLLTSLMQQKLMRVSDISNSRVHILESTDLLLGTIPGLKAAKTGWTEEAGECLATYVERGDLAIVTVVLGSKDRFGESSALIDWAFLHHTWLIPTL